MTIQPQKDTPCVADDYQCESCRNGQGVYYAPDICKKCDGTSQHTPIPSNANN